jgi:hypothetical protein
MALPRNRVLLIALFAGVVLLKIPELLDGRLWAEDGLFLVDALRLPWWQALATQHTGYIDVTASTIMLIASHLSDLEHVALISVILSLLIQICPAVLLVTGRQCEWLRPPWALIAALLLVLAPPAAEEIWLSPVTSQYHLMVCVALILALDTGQLPIFRNAVLGVASLTGPGPALVAPLFALRACIDRSWQRALQASILSAGALIETAIYLSHPEPNRILSIDLPLLARVIYVKHLILPFFGRRAAISAATGVSDQLLMLDVAAVGGIVIAALKAGKDVIWLALGAVTLIGLSYLGALGAKTDLLQIFFGQRYYYAPQVLIGLTLLGIAVTARPMMVRNVAAVLVGWLLAVGAWQFNRINPMMTNGPSWRDQIAEWRAGHRVIKMWPATMQIELPRDVGASTLPGSRERLE